MGVKRQHLLGVGISAFDPERDFDPSDRYATGGLGGSFASGQFEPIPVRVASDDMFRFRLRCVEPLQSS
jgi:hypothetical protein